MYSINNFDLLSASYLPSPGFPFGFNSPEQKEGELVRIWSKYHDCSQVEFFSLASKHISKYTNTNALENFKIYWYAIHRQISQSCCFILRTRYLIQTMLPDLTMSKTPALGTSYRMKIHFSGFNHLYLFLPLWSLSALGNRVYQCKL